MVPGLRVEGRRYYDDDDDDGTICMQRMRGSANTPNAASIGASSTSYKNWYIDAD